MPRALRLTFAAAPGHSAAILGLAVVEGTFPVVATWSLKLLLDELTRGSAAAPGRVAAAAAAIAATGLVLGLRQSVDEYLQSAVRRAVRLRVQGRLFTWVNRHVGLREVEDPDYLNRLRMAQEAGEQAPGDLMMAAVSLARGVLQAAGFALTLLALWPPALVLLLAAAPGAVLQIRLARQRAAVFEQLTPFMRRQVFFNSLLTDLRAAKEVRLFRLSRFLHQRMMGELRVAQRAEAGVDRRTLRVEAGTELVTALVSAAGIAAAAYQALQGRLSVGDVTAFLSAVAGLYSATAVTATATSRAYQALLVFGHYDRLDTAPVTGGVGTPVEPLRSAIELDGVWFRYGERGPWVLRGVNLTIPRGAVVGLVGLNGAGKSTLVKLLCRMYEPSAGAIRWDGTDLRRLDPASLRARLSAVFQDFMTYDFTAAENVAMGDPAALDDLPAIRRAALTAGVDDVLSGLPSGYHTLLSRTFESESDAESALLSGGQWQRVAIARAALRTDIDLLILDEPSSGLDAEAEREIHDRLRLLRRGRTSLLVSHRLSTLRGADIIYVLDQGAVVERGRHDELVRAGQGYARLFALQAEGYRDAPVRLPEAS